ncbi:MAG: ATP-binding protein [Candidatus Aminicenantes bacterium]|nr:ATP-binding protein [Candidatus Aminicenantes bacterium]
MIKKEWEERTYHELRNLLEKDQAALLVDLKQRAIDVEIDKRKEFENSLLRLARDIADADKRNAVYEVLVSLQSTWTRNRPEKGLQARFRTAFDTGNYREAEEIYKRLAKQGLDYIDTFQAGAGNLIPIFDGEKGMLLHYNKKEITFYDLGFKQLAKLLVPKYMQIIDVIAPFLDEDIDDMEIGENKKTRHELWILMEDKSNQKVIISLNIVNIAALETIERRLEHGAIEINQAMGRVRRLSYFQNSLLLVSDRIIYYRRDDNNWREWYTTGNKITAIETTKEGFWVGHLNGNVFMLKDLHHVGNRDVLHGFSEQIENIRSTGRYVLVWSEKRLIISDHGCQPVSEPVLTHCRINQATIMEENLLLLTANGLLLSRDIDQWNIRWQINLGDRYDILFSYRRLLFCGEQEGGAVLFEIPSLNTMTKELESKNIYVENQSIDIDPNAPVRYIFEFTGRTNILDEIKREGKSHYILYSEPRIGKTSILNVLREILYETSKCCVIDFTQLLKYSNSYELFEKNFIEICLGQYFMNTSDLLMKGGYHAIRSMVNKIKRYLNFCVFGLDNFFIPNHFDNYSRENFTFFIRSLLIHPEVRLIIACNKKYKYEIEEYFGDFRDILKKRNLIFMNIPLFSEREVKNAIRGKISLQQSMIDEVYKYTGRFPHLIHFYDDWEPNSDSIEEQSNKIAGTFSDKIFEYFRDLSSNARLLIATCLYEKLAGEKTSYITFYDRFPFLRNGLPRERLDEALEEIDTYGSGISVEKETDSFKISLSDDAQLFYLAARHISWVKDFKTLFDFSAAPDQEKAKNAARMFTRITRSELEANESLEQINKKFKDKFYIAKLTAQGLLALKMPLTTFIVIPLKPWRKKDYGEAFQDLYIEFQEFTRQTGETPIFYTLLFNLHGYPGEEIKKDLEGFDRISIIDAAMMKDIILADSPQDTTSGFIFDQLSIRERSPYTISGAVPDSLFFGREMEIALIRGLPENIGVFGTRTIGKTSLLRKLHKAFQSHKKWKVYDMDCARIESEETLLKNLAEKMEINFDEISDMDKFRQYVTRKAEKGGHRYLFLLDEVDRLVEYDMQHDEKIFNAFNRLCNETMKNNETAARFILFGFQQMFEQMKNPTSRLYNFMVFLPLQTLDIEGAMGLVTRPIEDIRVRWKNDEDAAHLVDSCSRHPRLLQAACQALLSNLDDKKIDRNTIDRDDVNKALMSQGFREICMRLYHATVDERDDSKKNKKDGRQKTLFARIRGKEAAAKSFEESTREAFLGDLHRITILAAVRLLFKEKKETFTIMNIQDELKRDNIDISPDIMRNILDRLCLSGNFRLQEESIIIAKDGERLRREVYGIDIHDLDRNITDLKVYEDKKSAIPRFTYEFGVKIFPRLLAAHFGGIDQCAEERKKLVEKGAWREELRRY